MSCGILCLCEFIIVLGQLNAYVGYYKKNEMIEGDNPPVGILLCTDKGSQMVEYALSGMDNQLFVSTYMLHLPDKKKLEEFMLKEIEEWECKVKHFVIMGMKYFLLNVDSLEF